MEWFCSWNSCVCVCVCVCVCDRSFITVKKDRETWHNHQKRRVPPTTLVLSVQFSHSVMSDSLRPHGLQHTSLSIRFPWVSPTPGACSYPCPLSLWCHPTISPSVVALSPCLQSFPASGSFPMSQFFASGGQSIGVSASASALPMNIQDWSPLGWAGWISLQSKGLSRVFSNTTIKSINSLVLSFLYSPTLTSIYDHWKNHSLD